MVRVRFRVGKALDKLRAVPTLAAQKFREKLGSEVSPDLQERILELMADTPGEPSSPFEFATIKSARFYFWLITSSVFSAGSDGAHWIRSGELENGWRVEVNYGALRATIRVYNVFPWSKYVYGPKNQVEGHRLTGWGEQIEQARSLSLRDAKRATFIVWGASVREAAKELGLNVR